MNKFICLLLLLFSNLIYAEYNHSIMGASASGMLVERDSSDDADYTLAIAGGYAYYLGQNIQLETQAAAALYLAGQDSAEYNAFNVAFGPVFNVFTSEKNKLQNAFFFSPKFGIERDEVKVFGITYHETEKFYRFELGKRFALTDQISWNVSLMASDYIDSDYETEVDFQFNLLYFTFYL